MRNRFTLSLTAGIAVALLLVCLIPRADSQTKSNTPPRAAIIYSQKIGSGNKFRLYLANWPNPKPRLLNPKTLGKYRLGDYAIFPQFSPDGTKVLFLANRILPNGEQVESDGVKGMDLWVLDISKNTVKPITTDGAAYDFPQWSPDGRYISAVSREGYWPPPGPIDSIEEWKLNLYAWDVKTGKRKYLAPYVQGVAWSRDSNYLYYEGGDDESGPAVFRISRKGGKPEVIQKQIAWIGWVSPNEKYLSLGGFKLGIRNLAAKTVKYYLHQKSPVLQGDHLWAPDSRRIAVRDVTDTGYPQTARLILLDIKTGQTRSLDDQYNQGGILAWSRDGQWIVVGRSKGTGETAAGTLDIVSAKTGKGISLVELNRVLGSDWHEISKR